MKTKIIVVFVFMLFIASMAIPLSATNNKSEQLPLSADVPIWEVGDSWTYHIDYYESDVNETLVFTMKGSITYEVTDDSGDYYIVKGSGRPLGIIQYGNIYMRTSIFTSTSFEMKIRKSDLGFEYANYDLKGLCWLTLGGIPLPIPIQIYSFKNTEFDPIQGFMPFPLNDGDYGTISSIDFSIVSGTSLFWGLIELNYIEDSWPCGDLDYTITAEQITVPAGDLDVLAIEAENHVEDYYNSWYCEEIGNVAMESILIHIGNTDKIYLLIEMELEETTYEL